MVLLRDGRLRIEGTSDARLLPRMAPVKDLLPVVQHVVESVSNIVIPDLATYGLSGRSGARFFAGVPLAVEGVGVGALCVVGEHPGRMDVEDFSLLDALGRRAAAALDEDQERAPAFWAERGMLSREGLELLLLLETRRLLRTDGRLVLAACESTGDGWTRRITARFAPRRAALGRLEANRHGLLLVRERGGGGTANRELRETLDALVAEADVRGIGLVSIEGSPIRLPAQELLDLAGSMCDRSARSGRKWIEEIEIRHRAGAGAAELGR